MIAVPVQKTAWHAAQIKRSAFHLAERGLLRQGYDVFVPKVERLVSRFGKRRPEPQLMFPGYIFVAVDPRQPNWRAINSTPGVSRLVMHKPTVPASLPHDFVRALRARCDEDGCLRSVDGLQAGDQVNIIAGPFAGLVSSIDRIDEARRIWILVDLLGGVRQITVDPDHLRIVI